MTVGNFKCNDTDNFYDFYIAVLENHLDLASEYVYSIFSVWFEDIPSHTDVQIALTNL